MPVPDVLRVTPLQPVSKPIPSAQTANNESFVRLPFFLPEIQRAPAKDGGGNAGLECGPGCGSGFGDADAVWLVCIASEKVAVCCNEPDVAVTVTVDV